MTLERKIVYDYVLTNHAAERFEERFPGLDVSVVFAIAIRTRTGRSLLRRIRHQCWGHRELVSQNFKGYYYKVAEKAGVVFVCAPPRIIITVFPLV